MKRKVISTICTLAISGVALLQSSHPAAGADKPGSTVSLADLRNQLAMLQTEVAAVVEGMNAVKGSAKKPAELSQAVANLGHSFDALQNRVNMLQTNAVTVKAR